MKHKKTETFLVTGGAGFIGSNFIRYVLAERPRARVVCLDALTYAGNPDNLKGLDAKRVVFVKGDIANRALVSKLFSREKPTYVVNFAAESHVDRSIHEGAEVFARTNVLGTTVLLEALMHTPSIQKFVHVSTDEVYGSLSLGSKKKFTEDSPLAPNSPYAASKAAGDMIVRAFHTTYGLPLVITRCSNNFGPFQHPEKLIPYSITRIMNGKPIALYGDGAHVRDWLHVEDHCSAIMAALMRGVPGETYNVGGSNEVSNRTIAAYILAYFKQDPSHIEFVRDRPGHDRRYAIDARKIRRELGLKPKHPFKRSLEATLLWYIQHDEWSRRALKRSGTANKHI